ncbi:DUF3237 domain-containing protein [Aliifodinibius sp. S!AR15-10]|uniref:DUF3237 family protein n=1 Tax=Aliifodinibius sp. S!AR15-10 TaxID=2950437 RepID=UPI00285E604F|nr:DUF3237 family protein [Aliifodinibius sp. S!AR15-10]MDR8390801.1 DUF3237 domain-containing protein [Aliifodinibius sp. S!AR15-10]
MNININENTELLFEEKLHLTNITEYGLKWSELTNGITAPGPEGARFDLDFEGLVHGPKINGTIKGTDYLEVRADGKFMLNIQAAVITDDGKRIAVREDGVLYPHLNGKAHIQLNLQFQTHYPEYRWMNNIQGWAICEVDMMRGEVNVKVYNGQFETIAETA